MHGQLANVWKGLDCDTKGTVFVRGGGIYTFWTLPWPSISAPSSNRVPTLSLRWVHSLFAYVQMPNHKSKSFFKSGTRQQRCTPVYILSGATDGSKLKQPSAIAYNINWNGI